MGWRSHPRSFLSRYRARLYRLGLRNPFERERFEFSDGISRQWRRGGRAGAALQATRSVNPSDIYVDKLFRAGQLASPPASSTAAGNPNPAALSGANINQSRAEILRLWTASFRDDQDLSAADKAYVAQAVAARTGLSQADAEKRVNDVITEAKTAADDARKGAAKLSFWLTAAMLFGAFASSLAAVEGGSLRDGTWTGRVLTIRPI